MKNNELKLACLVAVFYFGMDISAQAKKDTVTREKKIEEVVMIGYGRQKKVDVTSSIATVSPEVIQKTPAGQVTQAIQGQVAGVQVSSFGAPGDSPQINIRGIHSLYGSATPLFVVDGVFVDNIDFLNSNDIKEFTVLKDASASAIYGVRAANGVVVITTKGGNYNRKARITYTGYSGVQQGSDFIKMANSQEFTNFYLESGSNAEIATIANSIQRYGRSRVDPNIPNVNTDWFREVSRIATIQNHDLSVEGGTDKIAYSLGGNFFYQDGILRMINNYQRFNIRAKVDVKAADWLNVGANIVYSNSIKYGSDNSVWQLAYYAAPIVPVYDYLGYPDTTSVQYPSPYASSRYLGFRSDDNPFANLDNQNNKGERSRIVANVYADFWIVPKQLDFRSSLSYNNVSDVNRLVTLPYYVSDSYQRTVAQSTLTNSNGLNKNYIWDNTLTFNKKFGDHDFTVLGGFSFRDESFNYFWITGNFDPSGAFVRDKEQSWYLQNTSSAGRTSGNDSGGLLPYHFYGVSYFGRFAYTYKNKYNIYVTDREEGSNKYNNQKYVNLPAFGAGWTVSNESFMKGSSWLNLWKLRAGWGRLANDAVPAARIPSATTVTSVFDNTKATGFTFSTYNDQLAYEFTEELNVGSDLELLHRKLSITADYFVKDTKNLAITVNPQVGNVASYANVGTLRNKGFEISATWKDKIGENFGYSISGNFTHIKNYMTSLGGQDYLTTGLAEFPQRLAVGQAVNSFYGYVLDGVYQNSAQIAADPTAVYANSQGTGIQPGYFKYKDLNGDGRIDDKDRTYLGSPTPTYYFGGNLGLNYKNWDFSVTIYGQGGNYVLDRNRAEVFRTAGRNIDAELAVNRWHGDGTTNAFPSAAGYQASWNWKESSFWVQKGDFVRIQNIQLGYNFKQNGLPEMRFTLTADRPYRWAKSKTINPEVGFDGVDLNIYPTPSTFTFGYSVKF